ncbi:MAG: GNAT family N-acetyltransferase [Burkholderiales bacterium]
MSATLLIRRASVKDAPAMARYMSDPVIFGALLQMPYPSEETWQARLADGNAPGKTDLALVAERDGDLVGSAGLFNAGPAVRRRHAMGLGISVASVAQGQGVGTALMTALCDYADNWQGCLRIELTVYTDNLIAQRLYRNFGFEIEGTFRAYALRDGVYVDAHSMARLHPNPPSIRAAVVDA